jgi:hypothetical protein
MLELKATLQSAHSHTHIPLGLLGQGKAWLPGAPNVKRQQETRSPGEKVELATAPILGANANEQDPGGVLHGLVLGPEPPCCQL